MPVLPISNPKCDDENVSTHCQMSQGASHSQLRTTRLEEQPFRTDPLPYSYQPYSPPLTVCEEHQSLTTGHVVMMLPSNHLWLLTWILVAFSWIFCLWTLPACREKCVTPLKASHLVAFAASMSTPVCC